MHVAAPIAVRPSACACDACAAFAAPSPRAGAAVELRRLREGDSFVELTALFHRAYRAQVAMGLRPLAGRQTPEVTRKRCTSGECHLAIMPAATPHGAAEAERMVGVILLQEMEEAAFPPHFLDPRVAHFSLFAVDPAFQGHGIGRLLLETTERRALELGKAELALSMAEPDGALMRFYLKRGYRLVQHWQWPYTNYRSAILSKALAGAGW